MPEPKRPALNRIREHRIAQEIVQLDPVKPDKATREAVEDWRYWMAMGYVF